MYEPQHVIERRQQAAQLLDLVLDEQLEPRRAINRWPEMGAAFDPSLEAAYQALWHFEADEDRHKQEVFYLDAQLELLKQMAGTLRQGHALPKYMTQAYSPDTHIRFFYGGPFLQELLQGLRNCVQSAWQGIRGLRPDA